MFNFGMAYFSGTGTERDEVAAGGWLRRAAEAGHHGAMYILAHLLEAGRGGFERDLERSQQWFRRAANDGYVPPPNTAEHIQHVLRSTPGPAAPTRDD